MKLFIITDCLCNSTKHEPIIYTYPFRIRRDATIKFNKMIASLKESSKTIKSPMGAKVNYKHIVYDNQRPVRLIQLKEVNSSTEE